MKRPVHVMRASWLVIPLVGLVTVAVFAVIYPPGATPASVMDVKEWWCSYTITIAADETNSWIDTNGEHHDSHHVSRRCVGTLHLNSISTYGKSVRAWYARDNSTASASVDDRSERSLSSIGEGGVRVNEGVKETWTGYGDIKVSPSPHCSLTIDAENGTYALTFPDDARKSYEARDLTITASTLRWSLGGKDDTETRGDRTATYRAGRPDYSTDPTNPFFDGRILDQKLPGTGLSGINGTISFEVRKMAQRDLKKPVRVTYMWVLSPKPPEEVELVLGPQNAKQYSDWRPLGSTSEDVPGAHLRFKATLQKKGGGKAQSTATAITFRLADVSHEPGVCINFPRVPKDPDSPDLKFMSQYNPKLKVTADQMTARSGGSLTSATATVSSFDFGAFGLLQATAELEDGREILATIKDQPGRTSLRIPLSLEGSRIATSWRTSNKADGADDSDMDDFPEGDGNKGDGLTLYEEYRGIMKDTPAFSRSYHTWTDLNPHQKDFFIINHIGGDAKRAIGMFKELSGLAVHDEMTENNTAFRVVNFNSAVGGRHVDQHAIRLQRSPEPLISRAYGGPGLPKDIDVVLIAGGAARPGDADAPVMIQATVHELFHCCNVWHHGEVDTGFQRWIIEKDENGERYAWRAKVDETGQTIGKLDAAPIQLFREEHPDTEIQFPGTRSGIDVYVGDPHGQNSGDEACVMRYHTAMAYLKKAPLQYYWVPFEGAPASLLCTTTVGHDINRLGRTPRTRYYGADTQCHRGNCAAQICVNDGAHIKRRDCRFDAHPEKSP